jgi:hypothetical protein
MVWTGVWVGYIASRAHPKFRFRKIDHYMLKRSGDLCSVPDTWSLIHESMYVKYIWNLISQGRNCDCVCMRWMNKEWGRSTVNLPLLGLHKVNSEYRLYGHWNCAANWKPIYERFGNISSWMISQPVGCSCFKNSPIFDVRSIFPPPPLQELMKYVTKIQNSFKNCEKEENVFCTKYNYLET